MADALQPGDIVRFMSFYLGVVSHAWTSELATSSGQLVSIDYLGEKRHWAFGWHIGVVDAEAVEFMAKGVPPGAPVEELGMGHPWIMARTQARIDASMARSQGASFAEALAMAETRAADLFGSVPTGWVATAVARAYTDDAIDRRIP